MDSPTYIARNLRDANQREVPESRLVSETGVSVILAEPGAGKSELLRSVASQIETTVERASIFRCKPLTQTETLIIDALDEVAKLDQTAVNSIFVNAQQSGANQIIFASRSSEWDYSRTKFLEDCFCETPKVYGLYPFNPDEQAQLFASLCPDTLFEDFFAEVSQHGMENLLGNPVFLRLFSEAFVQTNGKFGAKNDIFEQAIRSLARETNSIPLDRGRPADTELIEHSSEIFAILLLSGTAGISSNADSAVDGFVEFQTISDPSKLGRLLDTRLFRPADLNDQHEPAHRIIAEYCAGKFLAEKLSDVSSNLSLRRLLALIAPNGAVRDDLRGLIGWIAAFGNQSVQEAVINADAYAVLANGDPSRLSASSKRYLLERLVKLNEVDPYFRGSDGWRRFSTTGFFTPEVIDHVRTILISASDGSHLRGLLLELIQSSGIATELSDELRQIMFNQSNERFTRLASMRILVNTEKFDPISDVQFLLNENSETAFELIIDALAGLDSDKFPPKMLENVLFKTGNFFGKDDLASSQIYSLRENIRTLCMSMEIEGLVRSLDYFARNVKCACDFQENYRCECRSGVSNVAAILLDAYFDKTVGPHDPKALWTWLRTLDFSKRSPSNESATVAFFERSPLLRQRIQQLSFNDVAEPNAIWEMYLHLRGMGRTKAHPAIQINAEDLQPIIDYAFETDRIALWDCVVPSHYIYQKNRGVIEERARARSQAREKPDFMRAWTKKEASWRKSRDQDKFGVRTSRIVRRRERQQEAVRHHNDEQLAVNEKQIRAGKNWWWLDCFAVDFLQRGYEGEAVYTNNDPTIAEDALINCFVFLKQHIPTLQECAKLRIQSKFSRIQTVLLAACAVTFRKTGTLTGVPKSALQAVMAHIDMGYSDFGGDEKSALEAEVSKCLFPSNEEAEEFLRDLIEPELLYGVEHPNVGWLEYKEPFQPLGEKLALEWLYHFPTSSFHAQETLFRIAARSETYRSELINLIVLRAAQHLFMIPLDVDVDTFDDRRKFWLMRYFYFMDDIHPKILEHITAEKESIFTFDQISGPLGHHDNQDWPKLTAEKIYVLLDTYIDLWPKVYLPNSYGTSSPPEETAYRFLTDLIWRFVNTEPSEAIPILNRILDDTKFEDFHSSVKNVRSRLSRQLALSEFDPPDAQSVRKFLIGRDVLSVEELRALFLEELEELQTLLRGAETDPVKMFYDGDKSIDENTARDRIIDLMRPRLQAKNLGISIERHMADSKRCDITLEKSFDGQRSLLVVEVKGQWHTELYTAASAQLHERYSIHPDAAEQGIYLVLWFGENEKIAGCKANGETPETLKNSIEGLLPTEIANFVDVAVLDLSRAS